MLLGKGSFAKVTLIKDGDKEYAAKSYHGKRKISAEEIDEEAAICQELDGCDYIVKYHGRKDGALLFERLEVSLHKQIGYLTKYDIANASYCILKALIYMREKKILHCDLKSDNIMFKRGIYKIIDFGNAVHLDPEMFKAKYALKEVTTAGSFKAHNLHYRAPEIILNSEVTAASDVWAFGCILYEMLTGDSLFTYMHDGMSPEMYQIGLYISILGMPKKEWLAKQKHADKFFIPDLTKHRYQYLIKYNSFDNLMERVDPAYRKILKKIFRFDPARRPSFEKLLEAIVRNITIPSPPEKTWG